MDLVSAQNVISRFSSGKIVTKSDLESATGVLPNSDRCSLYFTLALKSGLLDLLDRSCLEDIVLSLSDEDNVENLKTLVKFFEYGVEDKVSDEVILYSLESVSRYDSYWATKVLDQVSNSYLSNGSKPANFSWPKGSMLNRVGTGHKPDLNRGISIVD